LREEEERRKLLTEETVRKQIEETESQKHRKEQELLEMENSQQREEERKAEEERIKEEIERQEREQRVLQLSLELEMKRLDLEQAKQTNEDDQDNAKQQDAKQEVSQTVEERKDLTVGVDSKKGRRKKNEDAHTVLTSLPQDPTTSFFAVYDGHGGNKASRYCAKKLHQNVVERKCYKTDKRKALHKGFILTDEKFLEKFVKDGCTAIVALLTSDNHLYVANAGDSRCIIYKDGTVTAMSHDHKPNDEDEKKELKQQHMMS